MTLGIELAETCCNESEASLAGCTLAFAESFPVEDNVASSRIRLETEPLPWSVTCEELTRGVSVSAVPALGVMEFPVAAVGDLSSALLVSLDFSCFDMGHLRPQNTLSTTVSTTGMRSPLNACLTGDVVSPLSVSVRFERRTASVGGGARSSTDLPLVLRGRRRCHCLISSEACT